MDILTIIIVVFATISGIDYIFGSRLGLGNEFARGFMLFGTMALSMIGMIVLAPLLAQWMQPAFEFIYQKLHLDPSILPAALLANDMGGAPLSVQAAVDAKMGGFNALVVSSMMGATISFTIPFALTFKTKYARQLYLGLLCGIVSVPVGCLVSGLICRLPVGALLMNLLPLLVLSGVIAAGLLLFPNGCIRVFKVFGFIIKAMIVAGLIMGIVNFLAKKPIIGVIAPIEDGAMVCFNASVVMSGMFPFVWLLSKLLTRPLRAVGKRMGLNECSVMGVVSSLATSVTMFCQLDEMNEKGVTVNAAFAVCGAFTFAGHLAFTMAFAQEYLLAVIVGKLAGGAAAIVFACLMHRLWNKKEISEVSNAAQ